MKDGIIIIFLIISLGLSAQDISKETLQKIKSNYIALKPNKAMMNALKNCDQKSLVSNSDNSIKPDGYFKYRVESAGITDQKSSGRCWLFASLNVYRPLVIEKYNLSNFEFSQNYLFFFDQLEKANLFLESIIETANKPLDDRKVDWLLKTAIGDGGVWGGFANIVDKYGLVPSEVMPETKSSNDTRYMSSLIKTILRQNALDLRYAIEKKKANSDIQTLKINMLSDIYKILVYNLGEPPTKFSYRFIDKNKKPSELKEYTPISFYKEVIDFNINDYIMFMDDPSREYNKLYEIEFDRNAIEGVNWKYINIP